MAVLDHRRFKRLQELGIPVYVRRDGGDRVPAVDGGGEPPTDPAGEDSSPSVAPAGSAPSAAPPPGADGSAAGAGGDPQAGTATSKVAAPDTPQPLEPDDPGRELDWDALQKAVAGCQRCRLCSGRTQTVFGVGDPHADLVVVGEGPGREEDRRGEPFVGPAGQLLDAMLAAIDRSRYGAAGRGGVYIANVVKCRPPGNRDPRADEVASCGSWLRRQLAIIRPKRILVVGRIAAQSLLASSEPLARLRSRLHEFRIEAEDGEITAVPVHVTYHPAYLLRSPGDKAKAWQDLKHIHAELARSST